eukprot:1416447-Pyramimonas_sp.AAC.1
MVLTWALRRMLKRLLAHRTVETWRRASKPMLPKKRGARFKLSRNGVGRRDEVLESDDNKAKTLGNQISQGAWRSRALPHC